MKTFALGFVFLSTLAFANPVPSAEQVPVKTIDGADVVISATEALRAASVVTASRPPQAGEHFINDDGSVSVKDPMFFYGGAYIPLGVSASLQSINISSAGGACKFFRLGQFIRAEVAKHGNLVVLHDNGTIRDVVNSSSHPHAHKFTMLTCRAPQ